MVFKPDRENPTHHDTLRILSQLRLASSLTLDVPLFGRHLRPVLLLLSLVLLPVRSCPSARAAVPSRKADTQKRGHKLENDTGKMPILRSLSSRARVCIVFMPDVWRVSSYVVSGASGTSEKLKVSGKMIVDSSGFCAELRGVSETSDLAENGSDVGKWSIHRLVLYVCHR